MENETGYSAICDNCKETIKTNIQGNPIDHNCMENETKPTPEEVQEQADVLRVIVSFIDGIIFRERFNIKMFRDLIKDMKNQQSMADATVALTGKMLGQSERDKLKFFEHLTNAIECRQNQIKNTNDEAWQDKAREDMFKAIFGK